jgi:hypothetical protein
MPTKRQPGSKSKISHTLGFIKPQIAIHNRLFTPSFPSRNHASGLCQVALPPLKLLSDIDLCRLTPLRNDPLSQLITCPAMKPGPPSMAPDSLQVDLTTAWGHPDTTADIAPRYLSSREVHYTSQSNTSLPCSEIRTPVRIIEIPTIRLIVNDSPSNTTANVVAMTGCK